MKNSSILWPTLLIFAGLFIAPFCYTKYADGDQRFLIPTALAALMVLACFIYLGVNSAKHPVNEQRIQRAQETGKPVVTARFPLVSGLELPADVPCTLCYYTDRLTVDAAGQLYTLPRERILGAAMSTVKDVQRQYVSSAGGAVAGGILFGPLGAMLGGMVKEKRIRTSTRLLLLTYAPADGGKPRALVFNTGETHSDKASQLMYLCRGGEDPAPKTPIEL